MTFSLGCIHASGLVALSALRTRAGRSYRVQDGFRFGVIAIAVYLLAANVAMAQLFTDDPVLPGVTVVKRLHIAELRSRINAVRRATRLPAFQWTDPTIRAGVTPVKALHFQELRAALHQAFDAARRPRHRYTDAVLSRTTPKASHLNELRWAVRALHTSVSCTATLGAVSGRTTRAGSWSGNCASLHRPRGRYARYYSFTLPGARDVQIDLQSPTDSYLYLLQGSGTTGNIVTSDDDGGSGHNARITRRLAAGTYTIEATTFSVEAVGSFTLTLAVSGGCTTTSLGAVSGTVTRSGSWSRDCEAAHRPPGRYARYFSFTLRQATNVQIDLRSSVDTYMHLLRGTGPAGTIVSTDDDSGDAYNARITRRIESGTYTIEATTYDSGTTGSFSLTLSIISGGSCTVSSLGTLSGTVSRSGSWSSDCGSVNRPPGRYARYYSFTLRQTSNLQIDLRSPTEDPYLYLLQGAGTRGRVVTENDDGGDVANSRITEQLGAGTYTIEATTYYPEESGSFTLTILTSGGSSCALSSLGTLSGTVTRSGSWSSGCESANRSGSYARYYSFSLQQTRDVEIDLRSSTDSYLFLLRGAGTTGTVVTSDDDGGGNRNARIADRLGAGTYTIEATTFDSGVSGSFTFTVAATGGGGGGNTVPHRLTVARYRGTRLANSEANRIIGDMGDLLQRNDGAGDISCDVGFAKNGDVILFSNYGTINSEAQLTAVLALPYHVKVVDNINYCSSLKPGTIGCAPIGINGHSIVVERYRFNEGVLWAHEIGHNKGLRHRDGPNNVMNSSITRSAFRVSDAECNALRRPAR